jgi:hypothetical protein
MMSPQRSPSFPAFGLVAVLALPMAALAQPVKLPPDPSGALVRAKPPAETMLPPLPEGINETVQTFPVGDANPETAWLVRWATKKGNGLYIKSAWFKRKMREPWIQVLGDARLAQAFVPYHRGSPRFWDVSYNFPLDPLTKKDAGAYGELLKAKPSDRYPTVVKEIRDRGLMYKHPSAGARRGQTLLLWASLNAANYRYIIEYGFEDAGTITFRCGASGYNFQGGEKEPHMHNAMWRVDINLGGPAHNSVYLSEHSETPKDPPGTARSLLTLVKQECALDWDPLKFTMLRVVNTQKKNAQGQPWSYDLIPLRMGTSRHYGQEMVPIAGGKLRKEECTMHDFWITRAGHPAEMTFHMLPEYIKGQRPVVDTDIVLWYTSSAHHEPRSEDGAGVFKGSFRGATHVMWSGFDLRPRNFFDRTPFFPYP